MTHAAAPESDLGGQLTPGARPVVLSVDLMHAYTDPESPLCLGSLEPVHAAARVIDCARAHGVPVVHTRVEYARDGVDAGHFATKVGALRLLFGGGPMSEIVAEVAPVPGELVVTKQYASGFFGTSLASTLRAQGTDTVVVVGVSTSGCVRATAVDALQHGFVPVVVREAVGDRDAAAHESNLRDLQVKYAEVLGEDAVTAYLRSGR